MNEAARPVPTESAAETLEREVDEAISLCGGDIRAALRATLLANAYLESEIERLSEAVSAGFSRGKFRRRAKPE